MFAHFGSSSKSGGSSSKRVGGRLSGWELLEKGYRGDWFYRQLAWERIGLVSGRPNRVSLYADMMRSRIRFQ